MLTTGLPNLTNAFFAKEDGFGFLTSTFEIDWMTPASAIVATDSFQLGIEGVFFDNVDVEVKPADSIPVLPYKVEGAAGF